MYLYIQYLYIQHIYVHFIYSFVFSYSDAISKIVIREYKKVTFDRWHHKECCSNPEGCRLYFPTVVLPLAKTINPNYFCNYLAGQNTLAV